MNAPQEMTHEDVLRARLGVLQAGASRPRRRDHRARGLAQADQLTLRRLKKRKLALKDEIARIEDELYPDIIA